MALNILECTKLFLNHIYVYELLNTLRYVQELNKIRKFFLPTYPKLQD